MKFDATGIEPTSQGQGKLLPKQWFTFEVIDFTSQAGAQYPMEGVTKKNNYPKVDFLVEVVDQGEFKGERVFHTVTFMPKDKDGAGMAIHFLKSIGQPFEGKLDINTDDWIGKRFMGYAIVDEYNGKKKNKLGEIKPVEFYSPEIAKAAKEDTVPY